MSEVPYFSIICRALQGERICLVCQSVNKVVDAVIDYMCFTGSSFDVFQAKLHNDIPTFVFLSRNNKGIIAIEYVPDWSTPLSVKPPAPHRVYGREYDDVFLYTD